MKGFLATLLVLASTGMVNAQQSQRDFTSPDFNSRPSSGSSSSNADPDSAFAPRSNQTRLAALQSDGRNENRNKDLSDQYVIMDDRVDFQRQDNRQRPVFGPENDPRIRNAVQEQPRYIAQSSGRSETSVRPSQRSSQSVGDGQRSNVGFASNRSTSVNRSTASNRSAAPFSIYDLEITPDLEYDLKRNGYLYAKTNRQESLSNQIRLFGDRRRTDDRSREAKIFSSAVDTYQDNLVIDIDDYALEQIENGSYTLDNFDQFNARGVILRYVSRDNSKVDLARLPIGSDNAGAANPRDNQRDVQGNIQRDRRSGFDNQATDYRRTNTDGDGRFVLPATGRDRRDTQTAGAVVADYRDFRNDRGDRDGRNSSEGYDSVTRRNYQDRMADIYRDDSRRQREPIVDRRRSRPFDDVSYVDRGTENSQGRDLLEQGQRELQRNVEQLRLMRQDLAREAREIELRKQGLTRSNRQSDPRDAGTLRGQDSYRQYRPAELDRLARDRDALASPRFADRQFSNTGGTQSPYWGEYATIAPVSDSEDPEFNSYVRQNEDQLSRIKKKMAAISQSSKLHALENDLDRKFQKQQLEQSAAKHKNRVGTVASFNDDGLVRGTLGGNLAAGNSGYPDNRLAANTVVGNNQDGRVSHLSMRSEQSRFGGPVGQSNTATRSSNKLEQALWLVALLSIGMNLYLALLARSFYSRYNELADELRETFTASI